MPLDHGAMMEKIHKSFRLFIEKSQIRFSLGSGKSDEDQGLRLRCHIDEKICYSEKKIRWGNCDSSSDPILKHLLPAQGRVEKVFSLSEVYEVLISMGKIAKGRRILELIEELPLAPLQYSMILDSRQLGSAINYVTYENDWRLAELLCVLQVSFTPPGQIKQLTYDFMPEALKTFLSFDSVHEIWTAGKDRSVSA